MNETLLYPSRNETRNFFSLDGLWKFSFDPSDEGLEKGWNEGFVSAEKMPVPGSFADLYTEVQKRDYCGDFWYETSWYMEDMGNRDIYLRFGSISHRGDVFINGKHVGSHEGGYTPAVFKITDDVKINAKNKLVVKVNNELNEASMPCGTVKVLHNGNKIAQPYFDFFNYSGLQRSVVIFTQPKEAILDYDTDIELMDDHAKIHYYVETNGEHEIYAELFDQEGQKVASQKGKDGTLIVDKPHLWSIGDGYLYSLILLIKDGDTIVDKYPSKIGIRTIEVKGNQILLNNKPIYLKGYGKHEDFEVIGRTFNYSLAKRDFELMKWSHANCFRTSHYPYDEGWYQMADEEGFLIIDEVPAVGMMRSLVNFAAGAGGANTHFFESDTISKLQSHHKQMIKEMIQRDKNHPSVIAFSLFNEPETTYEAAYHYFAPLFEYAREIDMQKRPLTGALVFNSTPNRCLCYQLCDFISLNRYYGWYVGGGNEISEAEFIFRKEMEDWKKVCEDKPLIFTEFGADTSVFEHKLPGVMWTQEYQNAYYEMTFSVIDSFDFVQGELTWNFADFQTSEGTMRVNGNKKGVFTRNRQPKDAAYLLRKRWETK
ncbi:MAG: beta-glucuronidase [Faecalicoccus sp.]|nr:beta-glucuronidase [Faecalicoccus sp.]